MFNEVKTPAVCARRANGGCEQLEKLLRSWAKSAASGSSRKNKSLVARDCGI